MIINSVSPTGKLFCNSNKSYKKTSAPEVNNNKFQLQSYPKEYYVSFCGGKSLDLGLTVKQLQKGGNNFPPGIEEAALETLKNGNPENKRLVDIHKEKYKELLDCDNLEELKFFFPEFEGVKSISDDGMTYNKGSFIDKFMNGEIKTQDGELLLNPKKDLTLQLVQMYWGDALSLTDIKKACGYSISATMDKLNIPTVTPIYGSYLKLSDEESNKAITDAMVRNRRVSEKSLSRKGVPLTAEHKHKISESLIEYYKTHEHIGFERTSEDEQYFSNNPYQSEIFSQVLLRAWNYPESKSIKKAMSKFMKKSDKEIDVDILKNPAQAMLLKPFWDKNKWAKDKWSLCMTKSWERQKALDKMGLIYEPQKICRFMPSVFSEGLAAAIIDTHPGFGNFGMKNMKDMLSLAIPDEREQNPEQKYSVSVLKSVFDDAPELIINKNYDLFLCEVLNGVSFIFTDQIQKWEDINNPDGRSKKQIDIMKNITRSIDKKFVNEYWDDRKPDNLAKLFDMYSNLSFLCLTSESKEIQNLYSEIIDFLEKRPDLDSGKANKFYDAVNKLQDVLSTNDVSII